MPALPLAFGRFHLRLGLTDASGERLLHWLDDALVFLVYPDSEERGLVRLGGAWRAGANRERDELQDLPRLAPADGARARAAVQAHDGRGRAAPVRRPHEVSHVSLGEVEICCDLEHHVFYAAHTDPQIVAALAGTHWFEVREWATSGPGTPRSASAFE